MFLFSTEANKRIYVLIMFHNINKTQNLYFQETINLIQTSIFLFFLNLFNWRLITLQYCSGFCHTLTWISHGCPHVFPILTPPSHLPPHPSPQGHSSAPALSTLSHALNLDWRSISHIYQCLKQDILVIHCYITNHSLVT